MAEFKRKGRKDGRPKKGAVVSEKYVEVYKILPENGSRMRYSDIAAKLPGMSNSTITAALRYMSISGIIQRYDKEGCKKVEYSKTPLPESDISKSAQAQETNPYPKTAQIKTLKDDNDPSFIPAHAILLSERLRFIDNKIFLALVHFVHSSDKLKYSSTKKNMSPQELFNNELQFIITPLIKELSMLVDGIGLDEKVIQALWFSRRRELVVSDFADCPPTKVSEQDKKAFKEYLDNSKKG